MTAIEIIEAIKRLPKEERSRVIEFARGVEQNHAASPEELGQLAKRMVEAHDPAEADRLKEEIVRGFYGSQLRAQDSPSERSRGTTQTFAAQDAGTQHFALSNLPCSPASWIQRPKCHRESGSGGFQE